MTADRAIRYALTDVIAACPFARSGLLRPLALWDVTQGCRRLLLRKVGGDYTCPHRLLMEYFAGLEKER